MNKYLNTILASACQGDFRIFFQWYRGFQGFFKTTLCVKEMEDSVMRYAKEKESLKHIDLLRFLITHYASRITNICYNLPMKTYHYFISGLVQGVCFRHYTVREAERLGISGTVRNLPDDRVEVFAQGDEAQIVQFESFLHMGPRSARVERVERKVIEQAEVFRGFDISW